MNADGLVRKLDRLDHRERLAALIEHGRELGPSKVEALCRELCQGDVHRCLLALELAALHRDRALIWQALGDPSISVRRFAAKLTGRYAETIPVSVIDSLDGASLAVLLREVVRRRRGAIAEVFVEALLDRGQLCEAAYMLPACGAEAIVGWLDGPAWPELAWIRLAKHRPGLLITRIDAMFGAERPDLVWRRFAPSTWALLAKREPAVIAGWIDAHADAESLPAELLVALRYLVRWSPAWVVGVLASRSAWVTRVGLPAGLVTRARVVDDASLISLGRGLVRTAPAMLGQLLRNLPHPRRAVVFSGAIESLETATVEWPASLLVVLPTALRDREAARMLGLRRARTDASWRRELLGLRDIEFARPELEREGRSAQASERAEAHAALIRSTARSRGGMPETLAWLTRIRNEQDPVRMQVLAALAEVPGHRFDDPAALDAVIAPIFEARDTSNPTRMYAARIAQRLMIDRATEPSSPMFSLGLAILERHAGQRGTPDLPRLDRNLPRGAEAAIVDALLPWMRAAQQRQQEHHVYRLWSALGKRAWRVPALAKLLAEMIWRGNKHNAAWTAQLWLQDPQTRDERVLELVKRDRSALYLGPVFEHCHRRRQTLLIERFSDKAQRGRFHDGKVVVIPTVVDGFHRWPTSLQRQYIDLLRKAEAAPKHFSQTRARLIALRARVPLTRVKDLAEALASSEVTTQEAALGALVWVDDPGPALAILLDHLDGDRARVAMYAMPRLARLIPRDRMVEALAELLARPKLKVTVHKEALRLLGWLATPRAIALVRESWAKPLHRDVRIAALHAARSLLGQPEAWAVLAEAAADPDEDIARAVVELPLTNIAEAHRLRYFGAMSVVADHPSPTARAALFGALLAGWSMVAPCETVELSARVIGRLDLLDPWRSAAQLLAAGTRSSSTHGLIEALIAQLAAAADRDVAPAGERDRIAHQRLAGVIGELIGERHPLGVALLERLAAKLLAEPNWWCLGARMQLAAATNERVGAVGAALFGAAESPRTQAVVEDAARSAAQLGARNWVPSEAARVLADLRQSGAGLVAVAVLAVFGPSWGWGAEWTAALGQLREDPNPDVRRAAREVWIAVS